MRLEKVYNNDTFKVITRLAGSSNAARHRQQKVKNKACYHVFVSLGAESPKEKKNLKQFSRHMNDAVIVCARVVGRVVAYTQQQQQKQRSRRTAAVAVFPATLLLFG